jgi:hypothetical protein
MSEDAATIAALKHWTAEARDALRGARNLVVKVASRTPPEFRSPALAELAIHLIKTCEEFEGTDLTAV